LAGWLADWLRGLCQVFSMSSGQCGQSAINPLEVDSEADTESYHYSMHQISHSSRTSNRPTWWQRTKLHSFLEPRHAEMQSIDVAIISICRHLSSSWRCMLASTINDD
jgi:hypothetical protein